MNSKSFKEFLELTPATPPLRVSEQILTRVRRDLSPDARVAFVKLAAVHAVTALFTLSICPQFGIRLLGNGPGLTRFFMSLGHTGCTVACGFFFLATSLAVACFLLRAEELRVIRNHRWTEIGVLALLSLAGFLVLDSQLDSEAWYLWLAGAVGGALVALEVGMRVRFARFAEA
jgi:hypothetical protein